MKTIKRMTAVLFVVALVFGASNVNAQSKTKKDAKAVEVKGFAEGRTLTDQDLGFLNAVMAEEGSKSRGEANAPVTIGESTFQVGSVLSAEDVETIQSAIADSKNATKVENKDKSRGGCNLWCYYYLQDSYGRWYYYYYCCG